jgi:hypothetical protein
VVGVRTAHGASPLPGRRFSTMALPSLSKRTARRRSTARMSASISAGE